MLVVSQFTLAADTQKGMRPSFARRRAAGSRSVVSIFWPVPRTRRRDQTGEFAADMQVALVNDGPVTFWLQV